MVTTLVFGDAPSQSIARHCSVLAVVQGFAPLCLSPRPTAQQRQGSLVTRDSEWPATQPRIGASYLSSDSKQTWLGCQRAVRGQSSRHIAVLAPCCNANTATLVTLHYLIAEACVAPIGECLVMVILL